MDVSTWLTLPDVECVIGQNKFKLTAEQFETGKCGLKSGPIEVFVSVGGSWVKATGHIVLTVNGSAQWLFQPEDFTKLPKSYETFKPSSPLPVASPTAVVVNAVVSATSPVSSNGSTHPSRKSSSRNRPGRPRK